jgi:hypothetical protein
LVLKVVGKERDKKLWSVNVEIGEIRKKYLNGSMLYYAGSFRRVEDSCTVLLNSSSCGDGLAIAVMLPGDSLHLVYFLFFRSVLTRAELEALPLDNHLKEDVARGKVGLSSFIISPSQPVLPSPTIHKPFKPITRYGR